MRESRDCVVIGGGPAGSTFAAIVKKYDPAARVTVLEKDRHPRFHVGESLIPVANAVLRDLEVYDRCYDGRFIRKVGITFVWGRDRTPWDADYLELGAMSPAEEPGGVIDVVGQDFSELMRRDGRRDIPLTALNVRRGEFDALLLDQARAFGAEVREQTRVTRVARVDGAVVGVDWADAAGRSGHIEAPFVLDASGLGAIATRGERIYDPAMANFAVSGYLRGADWKVVFRGSHDATTVFIATIDHGWIWYFPVAEDCMSVGVVTHTTHFEDALRRIDLEAFFWESLRGCAEVAPLVAEATLRDDVFPKGRRVRATRDWSSWTPNPVGPGYATAGDAAVFIDPVLSSGLTMALQSGHRAACTFNTLRARPHLDPVQMWRAYADYVRGEAGSFLTLARYFYANNKAAGSWWWEAQRLVNAGGHLRLDDKQAFTMATAGFFPTPRAISMEIMAPLLQGLAGTDADLLNVYHDDGVGPVAELEGAAYSVVAPFRLALRAEPPRGDATGLLEPYHDLVCDAPELSHRYGAAPCRMGAALAPVVDAVPRHQSVAALVAAAPALVPAAPAASVRQGTLAMLANAAKKGYLTLHR